MDECQVHFHNCEEGSSASFSGHKSSMSENWHIYQTVNLNKFVTKIIICEVSDFPVQYFDLPIISKTKIRIVMWNLLFTGLSIILWSVDYCLHVFKGNCRFKLFLISKKEIRMWNLLFTGLSIIAWLVDYCLHVYKGNYR